MDQTLSRLFNARFGAIAVAVATAALGASTASAAVNTPVYPLPVAHGGDTCVAAGDVWSFGGGGGTTDGPNCTGTGTPPAFDTTKFAHLYWGLDYTKPPTASSNFNATATLAYDSGASTPATGLIVFDQTQGAPNTGWRLQLQLSDAASHPVALLDPTTVGIDASAGAVFEVTTAVANFNVKHDWFYNNQNPASVFQNCQPMGTCFDNTSFDGAFYYVDNPPTGDFTYPTPQNHQPLTLTPSNLADADGTVASWSWDLNGDGTYGDDANANGSATFGPGDNLVGLEIVDDEGSITHVTHTVHVDDAVPTVSFSCAPASPTTADTVTCTGSASDPDAVAGDPAPALAWSWAGNQATGPSFSAQFPAGSTPVTFTATDRDGGVGTVTQPVTATAPGGGGTGAGAGTGGGAGGGGSDVTPPGIKIAIAKQKLKAARKSGIAGSLTSTEGASCKLTLALNKKLAKKLKLKGATGSKGLTVTAGAKKFKVKLSKKAAKKLAKSKKVAFVLSAVCKDAAGNSGKASKAFSLK